MSLPSADDLFRPTVEAVPDEGGSRPAGDAPRARPAQDDRPAEEAEKDSAEKDGSTRTVRRPSGRVRHDEKMTVYVTADELHDLEAARLALRRTGLAVDRGRLVRAAIAMALADLDTNGEDSVLVQRLRDS